MSLEYKVKNKNYEIVNKIKGDKKKSIIITKGFPSLQKYIKKNIDIIGLNIINIYDPTEIIVPGIIVINLHLRVSSTIRDFLIMSRYKGKYPVVCICHPSFKNNKIFEKYIRYFQVLQWEYD